MCSLMVTTHGDVDEQKKDERVARMKAIRGVWKSCYATSEWAETRGAERTKQRNPYLMKLKQDQHGRK